jgi:hypothetical protein
LSMAERRPAVLKGLVLHGLTPVAAEVLTARLEEAAPPAEGAEGSPVHEDAVDDESFYRAWLLKCFAAGFSMIPG